MSCAPQLYLLASDQRPRDFESHLSSWAALSVDGDLYRVVARAGKPGSVLPDGSFSANRSGTPGMWRMHIDTATGSLNRTLVPFTGKWSDLISPPRFVAPDTQLAVARRQNPDDGRPADWNVTMRSSTSRVAPLPKWWWH